MKVAVGVRGAIVQRELFTPHLGAVFAVNVHRLPAGEPVRFTLWQAGPHGKIGLGKGQGFFVVRAIIGRFFSAHWITSRS